MRNADCMAEDDGIGIDALFDIDAPPELDKFTCLRALMRPLCIDCLALPGGSPQNYPAS